MTEPPKKKHALGLIVLPSLRGRALTEKIDDVLTPYGPLPDEGPQKFLARDLTEEVSVICRNWVFRHFGEHEVRDVQKMRSAIHNWCGANNVTLFDPSTRKLDDTGDWAPGLYASITDKGIGRLFDIQTRQPLFSSWEMGGLWSGFLRLKDQNPESIETPNFNNPAWDETGMKVEALRLSNNQDVAEVEDISWPVKHERGPSLCVINRLSQRFKPNEIAGGWVKPWCLFINNELLTQGTFTSSEIYKQQKLAEPLDWVDFLTFLFRKIATQTMEPHCVAVLDLKPIKTN